jgi:DNA-binding response OmpR family regulator
MKRTVFANGEILLITKSHKKHVLIAFQDAKFMELVCGLVVNEFGDDVRFVQSVDGLDATTKANFQTFNCIILESNINKKNCLSTAGSIRNSTLNAKVPILISSDDEDIETQLNLEKIPFVYVVSKNSGAIALVNLITNQLKLDKNQRRLSALILNTVTDGFIQFIGSTTEVKLKIDSVKVGEFSQFCSNQVVLIEVEHEWSNAEIYININDYAIKNLREQFQFLRNLELDSIRKSFSSFILRKCLQEFSTKKTLKTKIGLVEPESVKKYSNLRGIEICLSEGSDFRISIFVMPPK